MEYVISTQPLHVRLAVLNCTIGSWTGDCSQSTPMLGSSGTLGYDIDLSYLILIPQFPSIKFLEGRSYY